MTQTEQAVLDNTSGVELTIPAESTKGVPSRKNWCAKMGYYEKSPIARIIYARLFQDVGSNDVDYVEVGTDVNTAIDELLARA